MTEPAVVVTGKDLAAHIGCRPSYVVELRKRGRVVPSPAGPGYLLAESLALYRDTADPSRSGVAARHAAARSEGAATAAHPEAGAPEAAQAATGDDEPPPARDEGGHAARRAKALADKEEALAEAAIRENRKAAGELMDATEVEDSTRKIVAQLRTSLERIADDLAPEIAAMTDEGAVRMKIHEVVDEALAEAANNLAKIAARGVA